MQAKSLEKKKNNFVPNQKNFIGMEFAFLFTLSPYAISTYDERGPADLP
jgi:hypothetical protein